MMHALPSSMSTCHLNAYYLLPESIIQPYADTTALSPEQVDAIARVYYLKKQCSGANTDTFLWQLRLTVRANQWYHLFLRKLKHTDVLIVWNAFTVPLQAAAMAARELGVKVLYGENGVLPGTMALDPRGINFENALTGKSATFYDAITPDPGLVEQLFATPLQQRPLRTVHKLASPRTSQTASDDGAPLPERYLLFAMQMHDDSQILRFSPRFRDMPAAVTYVAEELARYNADTGDTLRLVVKEHPSDYGRIDYTALRRALPDALFLRTTPVSEIIGNAQAVVTVNSAVGVEGLLHLRPVITLGEAFYNIPGVVRHLGQREALHPVLCEVIGRPVNRERITKFLYFLRYEYLLPISPKSIDPRAYAPVTQRILDTIDNKLWWLDSKPATLTPTLPSLFDPDAAVR